MKPASRELTVFTVRDGVLIEGVVKLTPQRISWVSGSRVIGYQSWVELRNPNLDRLPAHLSLTAAGAWDMAVREAERHCGYCEQRLIRAKQKVEEMRALKEAHENKTS